MIKMRAIIPAAGWGTRMGSPPAKELLPHPRYPSRSFLEVALDLCSRFQWDPVVISRRDKVFLNQWLTEHLPATNYWIIDTTSEWTETILQSHPVWSDFNLILLPDVEFQPTQVIAHIKQGLQDYHFVVASHTIPPNTCSQWGIVLAESSSVMEKPPQLPSEFPSQACGLAWGLIGFRGTSQSFSFWQNYHRLARTGLPVSIPQPWLHLSLTHFRDLTRGPNPSPLS